MTCPSREQEACSLHYSLHSSLRRVIQSSVQVHYTDTTPGGVGVSNGVLGSVQWVGLCGWHLKGVHWVPRGNITSRADGHVLQNKKKKQRASELDVTGLECMSVSVNRITTLKGAQKFTLL